MKTYSPTRFAGLLLAFACAVSSAPAVLAADGSKNDGYRINPGDVLSVSVWREEGLQIDEVLVRPDGYLSFPLVGNLKVAGKDIPTVSQEMADGLKKFIPDPVVHIAAKNLSGNLVYVIGKVTRPGVYPMGSNIDVVQALSMAGGMTPYAAANKVQILRRDGGNQTAIRFAYGDVEKGENLEQNIVLKAGDVVLVP